MRWAVLIAALLFAATFPRSAFALEPLTIGFDEWPPYEYTENGMPRGAALDVLLAVLDRMGARVGSVQSYPWSRALSELDKGSIDLLCSGVQSPDRTRFAHYSREPLVSSMWLLFVRAKDRAQFPFKHLADLDGSRLGLVRDYVYGEDLYRYTKNRSRVYEVARDEDNLNMLVHGRVDYAACEYHSCMELALRLGIDDDIVPLVKSPLAEMGLHVLFSRRKVPVFFVERFNLELKRFKATPDYRTILSSYLWSPP